MHLLSLATVGQSHSKVPHRAPAKYERHSRLRIRWCKIDLFPELPRCEILPNATDPHLRFLQAMLQKRNVTCHILQQYAILL